MSDLDGAAVALVLGTSTGGVGRHVRDLATAVVRAGAVATVCGPVSTEKQFGYRSAGAGFVPVDIGTSPRPARDLRAVSVLAAELSDADVVHAHGLRAGLLASWALGRRRTPYAVTWHNRPMGSTRRRRLSALLERHVARRADVTLCVSADLVSRARQAGASYVRLAMVVAAPPPPAARPPQDVRSELGAGERPLVLAIGRLHPQKGFDVLVRAAVGLARPDRKPLVAIAGEGPQRAGLESLIRSTGAPVRLLGHRTDIADLLAAADVVVMPSVWEGSPLAAQETLLAGRPLVATEVGGLPDLVDGAALLVPPGDPEALTTALGLLLDDPAKAAALAENGRRRALGWPEHHAALRQVLDVYAELLSGLPA